MTNSSDHKIYCISYENAPGEYGVIAGPSPDLKDMLAHWPTDFEHQAFIVEFDESTKPSVSRNIYKFNKRRIEWDPIERQDDFVDPLLGHKYEVVLRNKQELLTIMGSAELRLQDRFFGEKPDLTNDEQAQFACVYHHGKLVRLYYDRLRLSDDSKLRRDLTWVRHAAEEAYKLGYFDGLSMRLSKPGASEYGGDPTPIEAPVVFKPPAQAELPLGGCANKTIKRVK